MQREQLLQASPRTEDPLIPIQAVILAGGSGTRLRSIVNDRPKPMAPFGNTPFLELQIQDLKNQGVTNFLLCLGYLHNSVEDYFGDGHRCGVEINYSVEEGLLGTAGALRFAQSHLKDTFLLLNGDSFLAFDLSRFIQFHIQKKATWPHLLATVALATVDDPREYGAVMLDSTQRILKFSEKPQTDQTSTQVNAGVYLLERAILNHIPSAKKVSLERETLPSLVKEGIPLFGYPTDGFFADIGTPRGYLRFQEYIEQKQS